MMSALRSAGLLRSLSQGHGAFKVLAVTPSRQSSSQSLEQRVETWDYVNSVYFGPERDMKNYPTPVQPKTPEAVRMGIIPNSWFDFFYPKTGVSGPYVFGAGLGIWMFSKEYMVFDHYCVEIPTFWTMCYILCQHPKIGKAATSFFNEKMDFRQELEYERPLRKMREAAQTNVSKLEGLIEECETSKHLYQVKKEGIELQLEAAYRQRLQNAYQEVKRRLDYELEKENVKRKFEQDHMVRWIVSNVKKSITPQQEKESIRSCIDTLKSLASKQPATA